MTRSTATLNLISIIEIEADELTRSANSSKDARQRVCPQFVQFLRKRFPKRCLVGRGRIIDSKGALSKFFDVIVADESNAAVLLYENSSSLVVPYESVYAVGDIQPQFAEGQLETFHSKTVHLRTSLQRDPTPANSFTVNEFTFQNADAPIAEHCFQNPLFTFFIAVKSDHFPLAPNLQYLASMYERLHPDPPVFLSLLDKVSIIPAQIAIDSNCSPQGWAQMTTPQYIIEDLDTETSINRWIIVRPGRDGNRPAANLAFFLTGLIKHCELANLSTPRLVDYLMPIAGTLHHEFFPLAPLAAKRS